MCRRKQVIHECRRGQLAVLVDILFQKCRADALGNPIQSDPAHAEDIVSAVGAFFKQLAIDTANVIEALSVLFNFDEIYPGLAALATQ